MDPYVVGLLIAFAIWAFSAISAIAAINSRTNRNLKRIGQRLSWMSLTQKPMTPSDAAQTRIGKVFKFTLIYGFALVFVLASWLYVAWAVGEFIYRKHKDSGAPQSVLEFRWALRNKEMSFDDLIRALLKLTDQAPENFDQVKVDMINELQSRGIKAR